MELTVYITVRQAVPVKAKHAKLAGVDPKKPACSNQSRFVGKIKTQGEYVPSPGARIYLGKPGEKVPLHFTRVVVVRESPVLEDGILVPRISTEVVREISAEKGEIRGGISGTGSVHELMGQIFPERTYAEAFGQSLQDLGWAMQYYGALGFALEDAKGAKEEWQEPLRGL